MNVPNISRAKTVELDIISISKIIPMKSKELVDNSRRHDKKEFDLNIINKYEENVGKDEHLLINYYNNILFLKLCIIQGSFWLSDESEKIFIFLSLVYFEVTEYINNSFYLNIINKRKNIKSFRDILKEVQEGKEKIDDNIKNKGESFLFSGIFYIIIQKTIINMNHIFTLLIIHCYDMNSSKSQQQKFIKVFPTLGDIIAYISNFKFYFITICYFLEINLKNVCKKKFDEDRFEFLVCFILKRIIINLKLNHSRLLLIFHSLTKSKE